MAHHLHFYIFVKILSEVNNSLSFICSVMKTLWDKKTDLSKLGNYVYGLAIPAFGSTYIVKYIGQASSSNPNRCFQHQKEAENFLKGKGSSNLAKVEMINYYASYGHYEIIILAHGIPGNLLDTMENIYRRMADSGSLLFAIFNGSIIETKNLTNIASTHNNKQQVGNMVVEPMSVSQIESSYASKIYLSSSEISKALSTSKKVLYLLNRPGIQSDYIGWWYLNNRSLKNIDWVVCVGNNDLIDYIFDVKSISFITLEQIDSSKNGKKEGKKKGFLASSLSNFVFKINSPAGMPCFDVNGKGWPRRGNARLYM